MSDLRLDPITGHWVAIAANRVSRPCEFQQIERRNEAALCPFCPGNENETPEPLQVITDSSSKYEWLTRVVPNKYPSFPNNGHLSNSDLGPYGFHSAHGIQEVIIQSPRHVESLSQLDDTELNACFRVFQDRVKAARAEPTIEHAMLFKNCRSEAGASLQHIHSQLIGTPIVPMQLEQRWQRMESHLNKTGLSILESIGKWELDQETRVLELTDRFVVFCPYASRFGYQVWIVPRDRQMSFTEVDLETSNELGRLSRKYVGRIETQLNSPAYNMLFHFAPRKFEKSEHWFVELFPRITRPAGFEWGTGWWVNPYAPEDVAQQLRD